MKWAEAPAPPLPPLDSATVEFYSNWTNSELRQIQCLVDFIGWDLNDQQFPPDTEPLSIISGLQETFVENGAESEYNDCTCQTFKTPLELTTRYYMTAVFGSCMAALSACFNSFVFYILVSSRKHRDSHFLYLIFLSMFDVIIAVTYIPFIAGSLHLWFYKSVFLLGLWSTVSVGMLTASHVAMTSSSYLLITATFERYLLTTKSDVQSKMRRLRLLLCALCLCCGLLSKGGLYLELEHNQHPYCVNMNKHSIDSTPIMTRDSPSYNWYYAVVYKFWIRNFMSVFVPFSSLLVLNGLIVDTLHRQQKTAKLFRFAASAHKVRIRQATKMLVSIALMYLIGETPSTTLTLWEHLDSDWLVQNKTFYAYAMDVSSLSRMLIGVSRLPLYLYCNEDVRKNARRFVRYMFCYRRPRRRTSRLGPDGKLVPAEVLVLLNKHDNTDSHVLSNLSADAIYAMRQCSQVDLPVIALAVKRPSIQRDDSRHSDPLMNRRVRHSEYRRNHVIHESEHEHHDKEQGVDGIDSD